MKTLILILLLALVVSCASPYQTVYVSGREGYYIAEQASSVAASRSTNISSRSLGLDKH